MKIPKRIQPLVDDGLVDSVLQQLMSGKEATVYIVQCGDFIRCAKVYKEASKRSFKQAVLYSEGRKVRSGRRARAMEKSSKFGREQQENIWQNAEVDALYKLAEAGVRVPQPYGCFEGVLLMDLITDEDGSAAPRLNDISMSEEQALEDHTEIMSFIVSMLNVGIIHGDLSEFNVLVDERGPVIIDLPQAVDASANNNAKKMLLRDVDNMTRYYAQFAPQLAQSKYGQEIWALYEKGLLSASTVLTGKFFEKDEITNVSNVLDEISTARQEYEDNIQRKQDFDL
ncbi:PA4780 family RIO1-like protein kinase [Psychromonas antarctica]|jgi:RIO kinase 1|uniref:PA4780 family RIO1-like protein kinase n=1 Tax=Psychromonas antarctica TaxID=67573 RepID=UPI001EE8E633|nr:PA4780 family RIO1-like protein kinase [Psychromonas antarctica]MCG6200465.1 serine protein kinase RIO [Psychromonas antarctica]